MNAFVRGAHATPDPLPVLIARQHALAVAVSNTSLDDPAFEALNAMEREIHDKIMTTDAISMAGQLALLEHLRHVLEVQGDQDYPLEIVGRCIASAKAFAAH